MKLTKGTIDFLDNFAGINSSILVSTGNLLRTIATTKSILADVETSDTFPVDFGIYDLEEFLGVVSLFDGPDFEFKKDFVVISGDGMKVTYRYGDPTAIITPNCDYREKMETVGEFVASEFVLPNSVLASIKKTASVIKVSDIVFKSSGKNSVDVMLVDKKDPSSNSAVIKLKTINEIAKAFEAHIKVEFLKFYQKDGVDYNISVAGTDRPCILKLNNDKLNLTYWVATEITSSYPSAAEESK